jgi:hypothetical protein
MLTVHIIAAWVFSRWVQSVRIIQSGITRDLLFIYLASYPALIGYTTTPLTDTFSVDLFIFGLATLECARDSNSRYKSIFFSSISALFFGYSVLVRPAFLSGLSVAFFVCCIFTAWGSRSNRIAFGITLSGCLIVLIPSFWSCSGKYGHYCLQSPDTFNTNLSIQDGLRGARVLWTRPNVFPGSIPMLADDTMITNYFQQCKIDSLVGFDGNSLTGCLLARPLTLPVFLVKKWIGLFDHFRFSPYLENSTPYWLRDLSRAYDTLAWVGFSLCFVAVSKFKIRRVSPNLVGFFSNNLGAIFLISFSVVMLAQHTALHTEERYGFPLIPLCTAVALMYGEKLFFGYRSNNWLRILGIVLYCLMAVFVFFVQIAAWDRGSHLTFS